MRTCHEALHGRSRNRFAARSGGRVVRQSRHAIKIHDADAVTADGQEVFNLLRQRGIDNVIIMGVHTNRCVLGRPFGIRQMAYLKKNVVLCRDLTDSYQRDPGDCERVSKACCTSLGNRLAHCKYAVGLPSTARGE